jgi:hypothetical protein
MMEYGKIIKKEITKDIEKKCRHYTAGECMRGKKLPCNGPCVNMEFPPVTMRFILLRCRKKHFTVAMTLSLAVRDDSMSKEYREHACGMCEKEGTVNSFYRVKEIRKIRKLEDLEHFCKHLITHWQLEDDIVTDLLKNYLFHNMIIQTLRNKGASGPDINGFLHNAHGELMKTREHFNKDEAITAIVLVILNKWFPDWQMEGETLVRNDPRQRQTSLEKTFNMITGGK